MQFSGPFSFDFLTEREWLLTNGLGGYASSTLCGMNSRRYHGLHVAALHPPGGRTLLVAKLEEVITTPERAYRLSTNQYPSNIYPTGYQYLQSVSVDAHDIVMLFEAGGTRMEKRVRMVPGENTTHVRYRNLGDRPFDLSLTPLVNARDFHGETADESIHFSVTAERWLHGPTVHVHPHWMRDGYWLYADGGAWTENPNWYYNMTYFWERRRGLTAVDNHFSPGRFETTLNSGEVITVICSLEPPPENGEVPVPLGPSFPLPEPLPPTQYAEEVAQLCSTAHTFLVERTTVHHEAIAHGRTVIAGYHWFGDWGRDTMIALPGLCLTTKRYEDAAEILRTFAAARRRGLLPNLFLDSGEGEAYNTVDASLWFFYAVERYYHATHDCALVEALRPALEEIIYYYSHGTDFGIGMAEDGLIAAEAPGWQLTWMDAKVGDWVVTPRMGKPVEINALWYNALRVMEQFAREFGWPGDYDLLADQVRKSYTAYWYTEGGYLYDVLDETPDARLRPNQIFAISLPHSPLDMNRAKSVVQVVERHLLTPYGLRTLAPSDPEYRGHYDGNTWERDGAYHQGTVWAWLMGPYVDAYLRVNGHTEQAKAVCRTLLQPLLAHVRDAGIGSISEIFEGNAPHLPRGTISQAWSVAEVLRVWFECQENLS